MCIWVENLKVKMPVVSTHKTSCTDNIVFCCNKKLPVVNNLVLDDIDIYRDRQLLSYYCDNCNKYKYLLVEYNIINNALVFNRNKPKRQKDIEQWLKKVKEKAVNKAFVIKKGNKSNKNDSNYFNKKINYGYTDKGKNK